MGKVGNMKNPNGKVSVVKKPKGKVGGSNKKAVVSPRKGR